MLSLSVLVVMAVGCRKKSSKDTSISVAKVEVSLIAGSSVSGGNPYQIPKGVSEAMILSAKALNKQGQEIQGQIFEWNVTGSNPDCVNIEPQGARNEYAYITGLKDCFDYGSNVNAECMVWAHCGDRAGYATVQVVVNISVCQPAGYWSIDMDGAHAYDCEAGQTGANFTFTGDPLCPLCEGGLIDGNGISWQWDDLSFAGEIESSRTEMGGTYSGTSSGTWHATLMTDMIGDSWTATGTEPTPQERMEHTAVWTGEEMIVWGGGGFFSDEIYNTGGRYDPAEDKWTATSTTDAPDGRRLHTAIWTGIEMIAWGGLTEAPEPNDVVNTGGLYDPVTDTWSPTSTTGAPEPRWYHTAIWTGTEMIIWGGINSDFEPRNTGARYNPVTDTWTPTSTTGAPAARHAHTAVWTGTEMIVWGGTEPSTELAPSFNTGARYDPATDTWNPVSTTDAAEARHWHTAVWTGTEMIVWGGFDTSVERIDTGGRYDPVTDTWVPTSAIGAPSPRCRHTAVWAGTDMIIWGGGEPWTFTFYTGGLYNPATDTWTETNTVNVPLERELHTAVWAGKLDSPVMIVWGGTSGTATPVLFDTGGRYTPPTE